jgi:glycosyltransferase involved in cell wall biosynthesis
MRVLHLDTGRELRGGQRQALLLYNGLQGGGFEQRMLCRGELRRLTGAGEISGLAVWRAAPSADLIHAHDARAHTLAALFGRGRPLVVSRRVAFPVGTGALSRWKYRRAARFLAVSNFVRDRLLQAGVPAGRIQVVYDGVAPPQPAPVFRPLSEMPLVVAPASADPLKGADLARQACALAGLDLKLSSDLDADLPQAGILLYLTASEGLGSALILAAMHAKPIVASNVGGVPEVVADGDTGLLTANDPAQAADALRRFAADPALARRCAEAAQARAIAELSDNRMIARTAEAYRAVLAARSPS